MIQKPPHPKEVWKNAQLKLQLAISVLEEIPQGSFVAAEAKEKLASYRNNYTVISKKS